MNDKEYQAAVERTANMDKPPEIILATFAMGISAEAGEVADLFKKHIGHDHPLDKEKVKKEIGDVLWYAAALSTRMGFTLEEVFAANITKLCERYAALADADHE
jgi:NTP pyrophosphatase (non-canonical NTP hydrolase)